MRPDVSSGTSLQPLRATNPTFARGGSTVDLGQRSDWEVAKAAYFPQINLTAAAGYQSSALTSLFTGPAGLWSFRRIAGTAPFSPAEGFVSGVKFSEARQQEMVLTYQQTIQQAFSRSLRRAG